MFVLGARHPGQTVEQQGVVVAWVSRISSAPGRCRITVRSVPTSESTPNRVPATVNRIARRAGHGSIERMCDIVAGCP